MIKAVVFDLDDTLYNEKEFVLGGFLEVSSFINMKFGVNKIEIYNRIIEIFRETGRGKIFNIIIEEKNLDLKVDTLIEVYRNSQPQIKLLNESIEVLKRLRSEGYKLGVITDGMSSVQWNKVKLLNLENYVDKVIVTDDFGREYWKPHKKSYIEMAKSLGININEMMYIGDNPNKDFITAKILGCKTIRIVNDFSDYKDISSDIKYEADYLINNLINIFNHLV